MTLVRRFKPQAETLAGRAWQDLGWQPADHLDIERSGVILGAPIVPLVVGEIGPSTGCPETRNLGMTLRPRPLVQASGRPADYLLRHSRCGRVVGKAKGLSAYAASHAEQVGHVDLVAKIGTRYRRLHLDQSAIRRRVDALTSTGELHNLYQSEG